MSTKHLTTGSSEPPVVDGKLQLYSMRFCPYAQRVHLVLDAKNIPYNVVYINLVQKPEWFLDKFPLGKVPAIVDGGHNLYESLVISDYLDENYPDNLLYPKNPMKKAMDRLVVESFNKVISLFYKVALQKIPNQDDFEDLMQELLKFDKELSRRGNQFFGGEKPGMVDYMIWPWFERLGQFRLILGEEFKIPKGKFNKLVAWMEEMETDEAVIKSYLTSDKHAKYTNMHRSGATRDYDSVI